MRSSPHTWALNTQQARHLVAACAAYRAYAWQALPPSPERNQTMKAVQAVQGRLLETRVAGTGEDIWLTMSEEEWQIMRQVINTLIQLTGAEGASEARTRALGELAGLRKLLEHGSRQTQVW